MEDSSLLGQRACLPASHNDGRRSRSVSAESSSRLHEFATTAANNVRTPRGSRQPQCNVSRSQPTNERVKQTPEPPSPPSPPLPPPSRALLQQTQSHTRIPPPPAPPPRPLAHPTTCNINAGVLGGSTLQQQLPKKVPQKKSNNARTTEDTQQF